MSRPAGRAAIGIDIGGTKIAAAVVAGDGSVLAEEIIATPPHDDRQASSTLERVFELAGRMHEAATAAGIEIASLGVGVPELVGLDGVVETRAVIELGAHDVTARLSAIAPVVIESDVRAAALGEARFGHGRDADPFAYVSIGTGISHCLVVGGEPYRGARGHAILLGGTELEPGLDLEEYASGAGLEARTGKSTTVLLAEAAAGEPEAVRLVSDAGDTVGRAIGTLMNLLDPALIILGGGLGLARGLYRSSLEAALDRATWGTDVRTPVLRNAELGSRAGVVGAATVALEKTETRSVTL